MSPSRFEQIKTLYRLALSRESAQRQLFLAKACDGDEELKHEVELLLAQDVSGDFTIQASAGNLSEVRADL